MHIQGFLPALRQAIVSPDSTRRLVVGYVSFDSRLVVGWWSATCRLVVDWWSVMCLFLQAPFALNPCQHSPPSQNLTRNSIATAKQAPKPTPIPPPISSILPSSYILLTSPPPSSSASTVASAAPLLPLESTSRKGAVSGRKQGGSMSVYVQKGEDMGRSWGAFGGAFFHHFRPKPLSVLNPLNPQIKITPNCTSATRSGAALSLPKEQKKVRFASVKIMCMPMAAHMPSGPDVLARKRGGAPENQPIDVYGFVGCGAEAGRLSGRVGQICKFKWMAAKGLLVSGRFSLLSHRYRPMFKV